MRLRFAFAALLATLIVGCGGDGDGESAEPTPSPTIVASDADKDGRFWMELTDEQRAELAGLCKNMVASDAGDRFGVAGVYNQISNIDDSDLARAITVHYQRGGEDDTIGQVCADSALTKVRRVALEIDGDIGSRSKTTHATKTGQVFPPQADVTVRGGPAAMDGWGPRRAVKVNPRTGEFTIRVSLVSGENDFRVDAKHPGMSGATQLFYVVKPKTAAERAAERAAREQARQEQIAANTLHYTGNGGKNIGTIKIPEDSTLRWTNDGDLFTILDDEAGLFVNSQAHSGDTDAPAGTYTGVVVNAIGNWTITITPK